MVWKPNVTVAAVVERDGRFLLVEEETDDGLRFNQPAGHLDEGESLVDAWCAKRWKKPPSTSSRRIWSASTTGAAARRMSPTCASPSPANCAAGRPERQLDDGIVAARWLTLDEIEATQERHRSPLILRCIEDLLAGKRYPLDLIVHYD